MRRLAATLLGLLVCSGAVADARADDDGDGARAPAAVRDAPPRSRGDARPGGARRARDRARAEPARPPSYSLGHPNCGRLQNGVRLREDETLRYLPGRPLHFGTEELVGLVRRAARAVHRRLRGRLAVGDLSSAGGGPVGHHASHQSGRDADLAFYVVNRRAEPAALTDYVGFRGDGTAMAGGALRFDTPRNWALVEALVEDPAVRVEHIFVSNGLRALLLGFARASGASAATVARAEAVMHQPARGSPHANHFHVRIACPSGDPACIDHVRPPPPRARRRRGAGRARADAREHGRRARGAAARDGDGGRAAGPGARAADPAR